MFRTLLPVIVLFTVVAGQPTQVHAQGRAASAASAKPMATTTIIDINAASAKDFEALPGVGAKTAARIVEYRQKNGPFKKVEDLMNVRGVGEKSFLKLKPQLAVTSPKPVAPKAESAKAGTN